MTIYLKLYSAYCVLFEGLLNAAKVIKDTSMITCNRYKGKRIEGQMSQGLFFRFLSESAEFSRQSVKKKLNETPKTLQPPLCWRLFTVLIVAS